jgi:hypothetical protein
MRNKQSTEQSTEQTMETRNPFSRAPRQPRRPYFKPQWEIEEQQKKAADEEARKEAERGLEHTEENFPTLVSGPAKQITWSGRKFTELASEWKEDADRQKEISDREKADVLQERRTEDAAFVLPRFRNIRRFAEPEEEIFEPRPLEKSDNPDDRLDDDEGVWETVVPKTRKEKRELTFEELDAKYAAESGGEDDGTVWGAPEEHQTCWDERR